MNCEAVGEIFKVKDGRAIIIAPVSPYLLEKQDIKQCLVRFDDGRTITAEQRKKAYAILAEIAKHTGNLPEPEKELQKYFYIARYGAPYFSPVSYTHLDVYKRQGKGQTYFINRLIGQKVS